MKKKSYILILLLCIIQSLQPISQNTAYSITAGIGMSTFIASAIMSKHTVFSLICAVPASIVTYFVTTSMTPQGRFKAALQKVNHIAGNKFAEYTYDDINIFIETLQDTYTDQFWLITSHEEIDTLLKEGYDVIELLMLAKQEAYDNYYLLESINSLHQKARILMTNLTTALRRIKNHADFNSQRTAYHQILIEKERLAIEREKTHAKQTQAAAQVAQAHAQYSQAHALWHTAYKR